MSKRIESNSRAKAQADLDKMPPGSVVLDCFGHAWQSARGYGALGSTYATGYWYRAYDGNDAAEVSVYDLSFKHPFTRMVEA